MISRKKRDEAQRAGTLTHKCLLKGGMNKQRVRIKANKF
jgi:hypothetical protein